MPESTTQICMVTGAIVFTPWDDALGSKAYLETKKDAIANLVQKVQQYLEENVANEAACTMLFRAKTFNEGDM